MLEVLLQENLDEHDVAPGAVKAGVALVDADLAEAEGEEQSAARGVFDEDFGEELPEAASFGLL